MARLEHPTLEIHRHSMGSALTSLERYLEVFFEEWNPAVLHRVPFWDPLRSDARSEALRAMERRGE
ncbi:MAG: hypothetical protein BMS9Abin29_1731 [Gemmatimonadota bacterium]|nr:MAG: hypothetical protein BMS9Abin29_1731 [Gemmatimonadota bacterium]